MWHYVTEYQLLRVQYFVCKRKDVIHFSEVSLTLKEILLNLLGYLSFHPPIHPSIWIMLFKIAYVLIFGVLDL